MAITIMFIIVALLTITMLPWLADTGHNKSHHTDLMAGDEGED